MCSVSGCLAGVLAPIELLADANVGRQQVDGSSPWVAAPHMGEPDWVLGFWLHSGSALVDAGIWDMKWQMEDLCFLLLPFKIE